MVEFKDVGMELGGVAEPVKNKYYPRLDIDLRKFPELSKEIGEECVLALRGKVVSKRLDEQSKTQTIEIHEIAAKTQEKSKNEADEALESLQSKGRY